MKSLSDILGGGMEHSAPKGKMSEEEIKAKLEVVQELMSEMLASMGGNVKSHLDGLMPKPDVAIEIEAEAPELEEKDPSVDSMDDSAVVSEEPAVEIAEEEPDDLFSMMQKKKKMMGKG